MSSGKAQKLFGQRFDSRFAIIFRRFTALGRRRGIDGLGLMRCRLAGVAGRAGNDVEARAVEAGFRAFCAKPIDADALARAVLEVVASGSRLPT